MRLSADLKAFETRIGYSFRRSELLIRAVTHSSIGSATRPDNQRLEFLGDRVLGLVMAEAMLAADKSASEGQLAPRFNALVRKETCAEVARDIGLGEVLKLGRSEMLTGGRRKETLLGDAMEALIAAVYLDGGFDAAKALVLRLWGARVHEAEARIYNPKSALQERSQAQGLGLPVYTETARSGPDHQPMFTIEVRLDNGLSARATAAGKRVAEAAAAEALLAQMENDQ
ncbi:ribonuclease III [Pseudotabrizicola sp. L79]|uniref:ribonuclease III n=1 Tax=Pseudotabrizicola sp. L79 TaxID=3118402 RepID=UPI002F94512E